MELFNKIRRILRGNKPLPNEHGPRFIKRDDEGRWVVDQQERTAPKPTVNIKIVPATTSGKADCVCGSGKCKCEDNKKAYAKTVAEKQKAASKSKPVVKSEVAPIVAEINKKAAAAKKPVAKTTAKKDAIKKDLADTPVAKKTPAKKPTTSTAKKSTPKKK